MRFLFYPGDCTPFHGKSLEERPLGGTETSVIALADALAKMGHLVYVVSPLTPLRQGFAAYIRPEDVSKIDSVDILVAIRNWRILFLPISCKKRFYWNQDPYHTPHSFGIGDLRVQSQIDALITVSDWQADTLCKASSFPRNKTWVLRNAVFLENFEGSEERLRKRLIYTSMPNRGLAYLAPIFSRLKLLHRELQLHIFSADSLYHADWPPITPANQPHQAVLDFFKDQKDCYVHGNILQKNLAREFMKSAIWTYPTSTEETSCISAMEAQAGGCAIVTTHLAGLIETVGEAGILIKEKPGTSEYINQFIAHTDQILSDDQLFKKLSERSLAQAKTFSWQARAESFMNYVHNAHGID